MHHSSPSAITYPSFPSPTRPSPTPHQLYYRPHYPTTSTSPTRPSPATDLTALPPAPAYSTLLYYRPHCPTTSTCPTPSSPTTLLTASQPHHLHTTYPTARLSIPDLPTLPMCTLLPIHYCALTCYTYYPAHTCHTPHHPAHLPHRCTMPPLYPIGSTTQPYLGHLYPPFSTATFIGLIRPIGLIGPTPTRARTGQVVGLIGLIGAIGLIPP